MSHLVEVVVAQTVAKIQVCRISRNRVPTGGRIKPYIHGVREGSARAAVRAVVLVCADPLFGFCVYLSRRAEQGCRKERHRN